MLMPSRNNVEDFVLNVGFALMTMVGMIAFLTWIILLMCKYFIF